MITLKRINGEFVIEGEFDSVYAAVRAAIDSGADLSGAYLSRADLYGANLSGADLSGAYLSRANLSRAYLYGANLSRANLSGADLYRADLSGADLSRAYLSRADLSRADLSRADLSGAYLYGANLYGADLSGAGNASLAIAITQACPQKGQFTAFKKLSNGIIAELEIPAEARRSCAGGRKCRAEFAKVIALYGEGNPKIGISLYDTEFFYNIGEIVKSDSWDEDQFNECSNGIHFYITREEAEAHQ